MRPYKIKIPPFDGVHFGAVGDYVLLKSADVEITVYNDEAGESVILETGDAADLTRFSSLRLVHDSPVEQVVSLYVGKGTRAYSARIAGAVEVQNTSGRFHHMGHTMAAGVKQRLRLSNSSRRALIVQNNHATEQLWLRLDGGTPFAAAGLIWDGVDLVPADGAAGDRFGSGVAISANGLVMAVGASSWEGAVSGQGGVYVYDWTGSAWEPRGAVLTAPDASDQYAGFGWSVALSDDGAILAVGARNENNGAATDAGAVYVFDWTGAAWNHRAKVVAADAASYDWFGSGVALSGDGAVMAVGAKGWEGTTGGQGGVYIFDWTAGAFVQRGAVIVADDPASGDAFGFSVAMNLSGSRLAVGAPDWEGAQDGQGKVYIFDWSGSAWGAPAVITAADAAAQDGFGTAVSLTSIGLTIAVGASAWEGNADAQGGVYVFDFSGAWTQRGSVIRALTDTASDLFGTSVTITDDGLRVAVGAQGTLAAVGHVVVFDYRENPSLKVGPGAKIEYLNFCPDGEIWGITANANDKIVTVEGSD